MYASDREGLAVTQALAAQEPHRCGQPIHDLLAFVSKNPVHATLARCRTLLCGRQ